MTVETPASESSQTESRDLEAISVSTRHVEV